MKRNTIKRNALVLLLFAAWVAADAQVRIDWQQCYGGSEHESATGIVAKDDSFIIVGAVEGPASGMVQCDVPEAGGTWQIEIDTNASHIVTMGYPSQQYCYSDFVVSGMGSGLYKAFNTGNLEDEYYIIGFTSDDNIEAKIGVRKIDSEGAELWRRSYGNGVGVSRVDGVATADGGVLAFGAINAGGGDVSQFWGWQDGWVVKMDDEGNMEWETTIGTEEGEEYIYHIAESSEGGYLLAMDALVMDGAGNVAACNYMHFVDGLFVKLTAEGEVEWNECYGGTELDAFSLVLELDDGYLLAGTSASDDGDLEGAGYHHGTDYPYSDIWLLRLDRDRNVLWSRCYGGTKSEFVSKVFPNDDGGFTVFGQTYSHNGDVVSAAHLHPNPQSLQVAWMFRVDANGNLLWEQCIGLDISGKTRFNDAVQHNDREYTIVGEMFCPGDYPGDINCTNCGYSQMNDYNYWILHVTDVFDYAAVPESSKDGVTLRPNPTTGTVVVYGVEAAEIQVYNTLGQLVRTFRHTNEASLEGLPQGVYQLRVTDRDGIVRSEKVVKE